MNVLNRDDSVTKYQIIMLNDCILGIVYRRITHRHSQSQTNNFHFVDSRTIREILITHHFRFSYEFQAQMNGQIHWFNIHWFWHFFGIYPIF